MYGQLNLTKFRPQKVEMNIVIRVLTFIDSFVWFGYFLFIAIIAIYLEGRIAIDPIGAIAIGSSIYLVTRALIQLPVSTYLDKNNSYRDEILAIGLGGIILSLSFLGYILVNDRLSLYVVNILFGIGAGIYLPAWRKTYAKFVDKGHEGTDYAVSDILLSLSGAIAAILGGMIIETTGNYTILFFCASFFTLTGALVVLFLLRRVD